MATTKEELLAYRERMARFNEWESAHPEGPLEPSVALQIAASIFRLLPAASRLANDDPRYEGVQLMYERLSVLGRSRE